VGGTSGRGGAPAQGGGTGVNGGTGANGGAGTNGGAGGAAGGAAAEAGSGNAAGSAAVRPKIATGVSAGVDMGCATVDDGSVWCWGANDTGQLGDGTTTNSDVPVRVVGIDSALAVTAGGTWNAGGKGAARLAFACAVLTDGKVQCWGNLRDLLQDEALQSSPVPVTVGMLGRMVAVTGGNGHACALTGDGFVECWGDNRWGELGLSSTSCFGPTCSPEPLPGAVVAVNGATAVSAKGAAFSCAVLLDGSVQCWGDFPGRSVLTGGKVPNTAPPVTIPGVSTTPRGLEVGYTHACAIAPDQTAVQCWGSNYNGALGDGTEDDVTGPVTVRGLGAPVVNMSVGGFNTCAVLGDGTVHCWGDYHWAGSLSPVTVPGIDDAVDVSGGYSQTCALRKNGSLSCWEHENTPVPVPGFDGAGAK